MSCSVFRRSSCACASRVITGSGTPAIPARRSTASGKLTPSVCITKSKMLPFFCDEKSNHIPFWSLTKNDGVFSLLNGESPLHSRPALRNLMRLPTTSDTGSRVRRSSRNCGENRMVIREDSAEDGSIYGGITAQRPAHEPGPPLSRLSTGNRPAAEQLPLAGSCFCGPGHFASWKMMPTVCRCPERMRLTPCRKLTR